MTAHTASMPDAPAKPRCKICGFEGPGVSAGLYQLKSGRFVSIPRCVDHRSCEERRAAL
jgi:hypothetical protein